VLHLFASDAVYLATAVKRNATLVTEDRHLLRGEVREYAEKRGIRVMSLGELG